MKKTVEVVYRSGGAQGHVGWINKTHKGILDDFAREADMLQVAFRVKLPSRYCTECGGNSEDVIIDSIANVPCEVERRCLDCKLVFNFWAYGSWQFED